LKKILPKMGSASYAVRSMYHFSSIALYAGAIQDKVKASFSYIRK